MPQSRLLVIGSRGMRRKHLIFNICGVVALLYIVVMTIVGYVAK